MSKDLKFYASKVPRLLQDSSMASNLKPEHYHSEANRLETFRRWTKKTPIPVDLASAGLFYEGNRDQMLGCEDFYCVPHAHPHFNNCSARTRAPHLIF